MYYYIILIYISQYLCIYTAMMSTLHSASRWHLDGFKSMD